MIEYLLYDMSVTPHDTEKFVVCCLLHSSLPSLIHPRRVFLIFFLFIQQPKLNSRALLLCNAGDVVLCYKSSCPYNSLNRQEPL